MPIETRKLKANGLTFVADFTLRRIPEASHWVQQDAPVAASQAIADRARAKGLASS